MEVVKTNIDDLLIIVPKIYGDSRGWFVESWQASRYADVGITSNFVQDNMSFSKKGTLRGLHLQKPTQGKLVQVLNGSIFDVAVDLRKGSPTFGKWASVILTSENKKQFWVPEGFAHGFYVMSETALFSYKCTEYYNPKGEISILWEDRDIGIHWPIGTLSNLPLLSGKDANAKSLQWWVDQKAFV